MSFLFLLKIVDALFTPTKYYTILSIGSNLVGIILTVSYISKNKEKK